MPTAEVETDDGTVEITLDEHVPDGYTLAQEDEVVDRSYHEKEIDRVKDRFDSSMREDVRKELKQDEDFRKQVAAEYDLDEDQRKKVVQQVEEEKVEPLREELQTWKEQTKREKILNAAKGRDDIDPKALQSVGDADPLVIQALSGRVTETDDGRFVMTDAQGNPLPGEDGGYASVQEGLDQLAGNDDFDPLFSDPSPSSGSGFNASGSPSSSAEDWDEMSKNEKLNHLKKSGGQHPKKTS